MHESLKKASRAILWVILALFGIAVLVAFLGLAGTISGPTVN